MNYYALPATVFVTAFFLALVPALWLPVAVAHPSDVAIWILYACLYIPSELFVFQASTEAPRNLVPLAIWLAIAFAILGAAKGRGLPRALANWEIKSWRNYMVIVVGATTICLLTVVTSSGWHPTLNLADAYVRRLSARSQDAGALRGYLIALLHQCLEPLLVLLGLTTRKWWLVALGVIGGLALFSWDGAKSSLVAPIILAGIWYLLRYHSRRFGLSLLLGASLLVSVTALTFIVWGNALPSAFTTRRTIIGNGITMGQYWEVFRNAPVLMRDGVPARLFDIQQLPAKGSTVGQRYSRSVDANQNASAWASAFGNFGYVGMVVTSIIVGWLLTVLDRVGAKKNWLLVASYAGYYGIILSQMALETTIITGGFLASLVLLQAAPDSLPHGTRDTLS